MLQTALVRRTGRKSVALEVREDGSLMVRAPITLPLAEITRLVRLKSAWIERATRRALERRARVRVRRFEDGERFWYLGREFTLRLEDEVPGKLVFKDGFVLSARHRRSAKRLFERWYREEAFRVLNERCRLFAPRMGVRYARIDLLSARWRWGTCDGEGRLRFNWRLIFAPPEILDYVVVHELAHRIHPNHSTRFWSAVEDALPGYREARRWLREHACALTWSVPCPGGPKTEDSNKELVPC